MSVLLLLQQVSCPISAAFSALTNTGTHFAPVTQFNTAEHANSRLSVSAVEKEAGRLEVLAGLCEFRAWWTFLHSHTWDEKRLWGLSGGGRRQRDGGWRGHSGTYADSWKRTGAVRIELRAGGGGRSERGGKQRIKGKTTPTLRNMETGGRKTRKRNCNLKKPQLLVGTKLHCVGRLVMWGLANKTGPLTVSNKVIGSIFIFEAHFDWSIRIPVVYKVYSERWLIVSAMLKLYFRHCILCVATILVLCVCVCMCVCASAQLDVSRESYQIQD